MYEKGLQIILIGIGMGLMIVGMVIMVGSTLITSEEGLNLDDNETTPEGKTVNLMENIIFWFGLVLFILGIVIIIIAFYS